MHDIKNVLQGVMNKTGLDERLEDGRALLMWDQVASSMVSKTEPVGITKGRMTINVSNPTVLHNLTFFKEKYIDKINLLLGKRIVRDIIFKVGKVSRGSENTESREDYIKRLHNIELNPDEMTQIEYITSQIEDDELRDSLKELFISQSQLSKIRSDKS